MRGVSDMLAKKVRLLISGRRRRGFEVVRSDGLTEWDNRGAKEQNRF